jgi:hypothetical protein
LGFGFIIGCGYVLFLFMPQQMNVAKKPQWSLHQVLPLEMIAGNSSVVIQTGAMVGG